MNRTEQVHAVLRIKAGVESAYLSLDERHPARAILGVVDDEVMRLFNAMESETPAATNTITVPR